MGRNSRAAKAEEPSAAVRAINADGEGRFVILCDHACRDVPCEYAQLELTEADLDRHIAWDPGALPVALGVAKALDAPLIHSAVSRLVIDVNRALDASDLIAQMSEDTEIPGNRSLDEAARRHRIATIYDPYHQAIEEVLSRRERKGLATVLISIHTFTPVFRGKQRPWHVGILHGADSRLARPLISAMTEDRTITVGDNQPYSPVDGVYYTLARHGDARRLPTAMIEIRNDLVANEQDQNRWAERLSEVLGALDLPAQAA